MRKCCCCVSVHLGTVILGCLGILVAAIEMVILIPYIFGTEDFNPIAHQTNKTWFIFEDFLEKQNFSKDEIEQFVKTGQNYAWSFLVAETSFALVYLLGCALLVIGVYCRQRCLMIPYLINQIIIIICFGLFSVIATTLLFIVHTPITMAFISLGVSIVAMFFFVYFWCAVRTAFVELGNQDYMYSPAPMKPFNSSKDPGHKYHPSAPQKFLME